MPEVLEIEQVEIEQTTQITKPKWDSWVMELPEDIAEAQNLPKGTLATMTYRNGKIEGEIIVSSPKIEEFVERLIKKDKEFFEEMKRLGD